MTLISADKNSFVIKSAKSVDIYLFLRLSALSADISFYASNQR